MPIPSQFNLESGWTAVAHGPGDAAFAPHQASCQWTVGATGDAPPSSILGIPSDRNEPIIASLQDGETLYLRGTGIVAGTADNPA